MNNRNDRNEKDERDNTEPEKFNFSLNNFFWVSTKYICMRVNN